MKAQWTFAAQSVLVAYPNSSWGWPFSVSRYVADWSRTWAMVGDSEGYVNVADISFQEAGVTGLGGMESV